MFSCECLSLWLILCCGLSCLVLHGHVFDLSSLSYYFCLPCLHLVLSSSCLVVMIVKTIHVKKMPGWRKGKRERGQNVHFGVPLSYLFNKDDKDKTRPRRLHASHGQQKEKRDKKIRQTDRQLSFCLVFSCHCVCSVLTSMPNPKPYPNQP